MAVLGVDPNLQAQLAMNGGAVRPQAGVPMQPVQRMGGRGTSDLPDATPKIVAAMLAASVLTIFLLRLGGFRFSFGAQLGGGS